MARIKCVCGNRMSNSDAPSKNILNVFKRTDVKSALKETPNISLFDFETSQTENFEYWYCTECKRVHVVEKIPNGKVIRRYKNINEKESVPQETKEQIYVYSATELYDLEEENFKITLAEVIEQSGEKHLYYLTPDKKSVFRKTNELYGFKVYENEK